MYNMNSPTLQAMLQHTPQGMGNMPVYNGNTPTVTTTNQQFTSPYPSPKDMVIQSGQQAIYAPVGFGYPQPQNIVGGYNPNTPQSVFSGYSNPYMGYGSYSGYGYMQPQMYMTEEMRDVYQVSAMIGITYQEQMENRISVNQRISDIVSRNIGRTEEEAKHYRDYYDPKTRNKAPEQVKVKSKSTKFMRVRIKNNDKVVYESPEIVQTVESINLIKSSAVIDRIEQESLQEKMKYRWMCKRMYELAPERVADGMDLAEFFTRGLAMVDKQHTLEDLRMQRIINSANVYNRDKFRDRLLMSNGMKPKGNKTAIERYAGRYGVMPDGRPITPGLDPAVAQSFSYNTNTGMYEVKPPNFISNRLEAARQSFIATLDNNQ